MWQSVISIDKKYHKEYVYIIEALDKCKHIAYAKQESMRRYHINVAINEEELITSKIYLENIIVEVVLVYFKYRFLVDNIHFNKDSYLNSALLSALVYCDRTHEKIVVLNALAESYDYPIDSLFKFKMSELNENWAEIVALVNGLIHSNHTSNDLYNLIHFILEMSEDEQSILEIRKGEENIEILNVKNGKLIDIPKVSEKDYINIISAIISANPSEILLERELLNGEIINVVNNIAKLKTI